MSYGYYIPKKDQIVILKKGCERYRGHNWKLVIQKCQDVKKCYYSIRMIDNLNRLPEKDMNHKADIDQMKFDTPYEYGHREKNIWASIHPNNCLSTQNKKWLLCFI